MPKIVVDPKGKFCWEANFNPVLRMSHNAISTVKFKMDVEKARYERTLKTLNGNEKAELRVTQREVDELRRELNQLKAYQKVAQMTAFEKFDPFVRRHEEEKARRERIKEAADQLAKEIAAKKEKEAEESREFGSYNSLGLLSKRLQEFSDANVDEEYEKIQQQNRRMSQSGNIFVTLQDIMDNDNVLKMHSQAITNQRRRSRGDLSCFGGGEEEASSRVDLWVNNLSQRRSSRSGSVPNVSKSLPENSLRSRPNSLCDIRVENGIGDSGTSSSSLLEVPQSPWRRKSRTGSLGNLVEDIIHEHGAENHEDSISYGAQQFSKRDSNPKPVLKGIFITNVDALKDENTVSEKNKVVEAHDQAPAKRVHGTTPLTKFQIKRLLEDQQHRYRRQVEQEMKAQQDQQDLRRLSAISMFVNPSRRSSSVRSIEEGKENDAEMGSNQVSNNSPEKDIAGTGTCDSHKEETSQPKPLGLLRGLARFKDAAKAVTIQNRAEKGEGVSRFKNLAAAVIVQNATSAGKMPKSFLLNQFVPGPRDSGRDELTPLEASHRRPSADIMRPLEMPKGVRLEQEKKWGELMVNVNGAVHWKVRALREDTGTMNPRQLRRQMRNTPREQRSHVLPDTCKTTWAMKRFVKQEVKDVLTSWQPENRRKLRNQSLIKKESNQQFQDRIKTTNDVLDHFKSNRAESETKLEGR